MPKPWKKFLKIWKRKSRHIQPMPPLPQDPLYESLDSGEVKPLSVWEQGYTLIINNDGTITADPKYTEGIPPMTLRPIATMSAEGVSVEGAPTFEGLRKELRNEGLNLQYGNIIPASWVTVETATVDGIKMEAKVSSRMYSGYNTFKHQQSIGAGMENANKDGLGILVTTSGKHGENTASKIVLKSVGFTNQIEYFDEIVDASERYINPILTHRQVGMTLGQSPLHYEGREWKPGDLINVSRPAASGGGLTLGHVLRIYPTSVLVVWPNDALHPKSSHPEGWTTEEDKTNLILVKYDKTWIDARKTGYFDAESVVVESVRAFSSEWELAQDAVMEGKPPSWTAFVKGKYTPSSPMSESANLYGQHDALMRHLNKEVDVFAETTGRRVKDYGVNELLLSNSTFGYDPYISTVFPAHLSNVLPEEDTPPTRMFKYQ